ncbi:MAG: glutaredoxin family protein [Candidatus Saccharimonadales bacterium]
MIDNTKSATNAKVTVYSASWCAFCHAAKDYLGKLGVKYVDKDIESDPKFAQEAMDKSGQTGIPVIDIAGDIIVGFDRPSIDNSLKNHKLN